MRILSQLILTLTGQSQNFIKQPNPTDDQTENPKQGLNSIDNSEGNQDIYQCIKLYKMKFEKRLQRIILIRGSPQGMDFSIPAECNKSGTNPIDIGPCFDTMIHGLIAVENLKMVSSRKDFSNDRRQNIYSIAKDRFHKIKSDMDSSCGFSMLAQSNSICANKLNGLLTNVKNFVPTFENSEKIRSKEIDMAIQGMIKKMTDIWNLDTADQLLKECA